MSLSAAEIDAILKAEADHECPGVGEHRICVRIVAIADLPTPLRAVPGRRLLEQPRRQGAHRHHARQPDGPRGRADARALRVPDRRRARLAALRLPRPARGRRCAHRRQEYGIVLYLRQEGRGIGLLNKLRAYGLQDRGLDTVEANLALGFRDDEREYSIAAHMLHSLRCGSVRLLTNNPKKVEELARYGVRVVGPPAARDPAERVQPLLPGDQARQVGPPARRAGQAAPARAGRSRCRSRARWTDRPGRQPDTPPASLSGPPRRAGPATGER